MNLTADHIRVMELAVKHGSFYSAPDAHTDNDAGALLRSAAHDLKLTGLMRDGLPTIAGNMALNRARQAKQNNTQHTEEAP